MAPRPLVRGRARARHGTGFGLAARMVVATGLVALIIGSTFALLIQADSSERASERIANNSYRELVAAGKAERVVIDMETGVRGFLLTKDPSLLQPWDAAVASYAERAQEWLALIDDPGQRARAAAITNDIFSFVNQYSVPLVDRAQRGDLQASSLEETQLGAARVAEIRGLFDDYESAEDDILARVVGVADDASRRAFIAALVGVVGSLLIVAGFGAYLVSMVRPVRRAAALAARVADGDLSVRMPETGAAEMGALERSFNSMAASLESSRANLRDLVEEQSALRRVATLVAGGFAPALVFEAVTAEVSRLLDADVAVLVRFEPDDRMAVVASVPEVDLAAEAGDGRRDAGLHRAVTRVRKTGQVVTVEAPGGGGVRSSTAVPVTVENRLWGAVVIGWGETRAGTTDVEEQVAGFTELVATALASAQSRADLEASRARVVAASDQTRRRIERDLHDGTQQRLVALSLEVRTLADMLPPGSAQLSERLARIGDGLGAAVTELQELSRGLHPAMLSRGGLGPAVRAVARRAALPVRVDLDLIREPPDPVAVAAYYVISEALTNAAKHAHAAGVDVRVVATDDAVEICVSDDGVGGADSTGGSGLIGLRDRVEALRGRIKVTSPPGAGTTVEATIPATRPASG